MSSPTNSLRLPKQTLERLDRATARMRRSRSFLMQEALDRYLTEIERAEASRTKPLATLMSLKSAGVREGAWSSSEDVIEHIRRLRDDQ